MSKLLGFLGAELHVCVSMHVLSLIGDGVARQVFALKIFIRNLEHRLAGFPQNIQANNESPNDPFGRQQTSISRNPRRACLVA